MAKHLIEAKTQKPSAIRRGVRRMGELYRRASSQARQVGNYALRATGIVPDFEPGADFSVPLSERLGFEPLHNNEDTRPGWLGAVVTPYGFSGKVDAAALREGLESHPRVGREWRDRLDAAGSSEETLNRHLEEMPSLVGVAAPEEDHQTMVGDTPFDSLQAQCEFRRANRNRWQLTSPRR